MKRIYILLSLILLLSCFFQKQKTSNIKKEFSLKIGYGENEIGYIPKNNVIDPEQINVYYRSGFYYISDLGNNKIMKITEKGNPILIIYNPKNNPNLKPTVSKSDPETGTEDFSYVKLFKQYPIFSPEAITCDLNKNIYFVNKDPIYKQSNNRSDIVDSFILKFNKKGDYLYKLGKTGQESIPFSYVNNMIVDNKENLIVHEDSPSGTFIYKFSPDGELMNKLEIRSDHIPLIKQEVNYIVDIIMITPGFLEDIIYITCQYVKETVKDLSITTYEIMYEKCLKYSLEQKKVNKLLLKISPKYYDLSKIRSNTTIKELYGDNDKIMMPFENLVGVDKNESIYFSQKELPFNALNEHKVKLYIYDTSGRQKKNLLINYPINIEFSSEIMLSPEGKLYSYFIKDGEINFVNIK